MLVIEIDGVLSHRQKEEAVIQKAQEQSPDAPQQKRTPPPPPPPQQKVEPKKKQEKQEKQKPKDESALKREKQKKKMLETPKTPQQARPQPPQPQQNEVQPQTAQENTPKSNRQSNQETIKHEKADVSVLKRYLARLKKALQPHIVYPDAAKNLQFFGNPTVRFSIDADGHVDPGSVSVVKSSQHAILDEYAIKAVLASSPLPKPPKPLTLQVEVAFSVR